jgi:hypothetical protein
MDRQIKFRAWDESIEEMVYSDKPSDYHSFAFDGDETLICWGWTDPLPSNDPTEPPEPKSYKIENIMQFTGLLDKNGKEIYEGDILIHDTDKPPYHKGYIVTWDAPCYWWFGSELGFNRPTRAISIVAGNIHENPELLK